MTQPSESVMKAILSDTTQVTRRVEILEQDCATIWHPGPDFLEGSVSVDYTRDERRQLSLTLSNSDGSLDNYPGGFWYDKIIRPYRGITYQIMLTGAVAIQNANPLLWYRFTAPNTGEVLDSGRLEVMGTSFGGITPISIGAFPGDVTGAFNFNDGYVSVSPNTGLDLVRNATIAFWYRSESTAEATVYMANDYATTGNGLLVKFNAGGTPNTYAVDDGTSVHSFNGSGFLDGNWHFFVVSIGTNKTRIYMDGIVKYEGASSSQPRPMRATSTVRIGSHPGSSQPFIGDIDEFAIFDYDLTQISVLRLYRAGRGTATLLDESWEVPLGDFMVDDIGAAHHPKQTSISGRDLTKRLMLSKYRTSTTYPKDLKLEELVRAIAYNGGIERFILPNTGVTISQEFFFEAGSSRQDAIKKLSTDFNYDIYFDQYGYMVMSPFTDPLTSAPIYTFETGATGTIASFDKKSRDTQIYNVVLVTGETSDQVPVSAVAENREPTSPTRIAIPGVPGGLSERVYQYTSSFISTTQQAQEVANTFLSIHALEEFEVSLGTLVMPWLEAGTTMEFIDPDPNIGDPVRYLLSDFTIPLTLGPMSINAKRVTIVG